MIVRQSNGAASRVLIRLSEGDELVSRLRELATERGITLGWIQGVGTLASVELEAGPGGKRPKKLEGPCSIVSIGGSVASQGGVVALSVHLTVLAQKKSGPELVSGRVRAADVVFAELLVECFDPLQVSADAEAAPVSEPGRSALGRAAGPSSRVNKRARSPRAPDEVEPRSRRAPLVEASSDSVRPRRWTDDDLDDDEELDEVEAPTPVSSGPVTWADVAALSAAPEVEPEPVPRRAAPRARSASASPAGHRPPAPPRKVREEEVTELRPGKGDFVQHRQFGLCKVDREDGSGGIVIKLQSGVRKTIKLAYMEVGAPRMEGTRRVFQIRPRKR